MRIEKVIAADFGPFHDRSLLLQAGMNVVYGPNESGKSTWHAALYAGLCGLRRGAGRSTFNELFAERHKPWGIDGPWRAGSVIVLADGRRVELTHDLASRMGTARDADLAGRDYSDEILFEGSPDGSRWLGLNRYTFLSTACIRQTQMLAVLDDAGSLQEDIQRAASTAGDATATAALDLIEKFRAEAVGSDRAPTKPLRTTAAAVDRARLALEEAERAQQDYLDRLADIDTLNTELAELRTEESAIAAVLLEIQAETAAKRFDRASALAERFEEGPPYPSADEERLSNQIATALQKWQSRPRVAPLTGEPISDLETQLTETDRRIDDLGRPAPPSRRRRSKTLLLAGVGTTVLGGAGWALVDPPYLGGGILTLAVGLLIGWAFSGTTPAPADSRSEISRLSSRREHIEHLIDDRRKAETVFEEAVERERVARASIMEAASAIGADGVDPDQLAESLFTWQKDRKRRLEQLSLVQAEWDQFQKILGHQTLAEIELEAARLGEEANSAIAGCEAALLAAVRSRQVTPEELNKVRDRAQQTRDELNTLNGELRQFMGGFRSVSEAEESLEMALDEALRVQTLDATLATTIDFLRTAEEEVHRGLAPVLKNTVEEWLGRITGGRYVECKVDPESLHVEVRGPGVAWRRADLLSHGTREQVYLLLRLALARHLTTPTEICPLVLDDVLTSFDLERRDAVLETLKAMSSEVQVVLFTHDPGVADWARNNLYGTTDTLIELDRV